MCVCVHASWGTGVNKLQDCIWPGWIKAAAEDVNEEMEIIVQSKKDDLKQRREAVNQEQTLRDWRCSKQGCHFVGRNYACLVNHIRQIHSRTAQCGYGCVLCGKLYMKQGLVMHIQTGTEPFHSPV